MEWARTLGLANQPLTLVYQCSLGLLTAEPDTYLGVERPQAFIGWTSIPGLSEPQKVIPWPPAYLGQRLASCELVMILTSMGPHKEMGCTWDHMALPKYSIFQETNFSWGEVHWNLNCMGNFSFKRLPQGCNGTGYQMGIFNFGATPHPGMVAWAAEIISTVSECFGDSTNGGSIHGSTKSQSQTDVCYSSEDFDWQPHCSVVVGDPPVSIWGVKFTQEDFCGWLVGP